MNFLFMGKEKMAKSGDSFLRLQTVIDKELDPLDYRYFNLNSHYRSPLHLPGKPLKVPVRD